MNFGTKTTQIQKFEWNKWTFFATQFLKLSHHSESTKELSERKLSSWAKASIYRISKGSNIRAPKPQSNPDSSRVIVIVPTDIAKERRRSRRISVDTTDTHHWFDSRLLQPIPKKWRQDTICISRIHSRKEVCSVFVNGQYLWFSVTPSASKFI